MLLLDGISDLEAVPNIAEMELRAHGEVVLFPFLDSHARIVELEENQRRLELL